VKKRFVGPVVGSYSSFLLSVKRIEEERVLKWGEKVRKDGWEKTNGGARESG